MNAWIKVCLLSLLLVWPIHLAAGTMNLSQVPLFITDTVAPMAMLVVSRDHKLYFEAYNDLTDVDGDGLIDLKFKPSVVYYGYFDSNKCYGYSSAEQYFFPTSVSPTMACSGSWSGNFLNYLTTSRLDAIRKVLYGGLRVVDTVGHTLIQRAYIPQEGHSWGKEYRNIATDGFNIANYTPLALPSSGYHLFANTTLRNGTGSPILRVALNQPYRIWEWVSIERPVAGSRALEGNSGPLINGITDYVLRVKVCDNTVGLEPNCRVYPNGDHKPTGLLQEFGENNAMAFGLMTGTYVNNLEGGVLRKNISSFTDEVNATTGAFTAVNGIVSTLNRLTISGFQTDFTYNCGWITSRNIVNGECRMWGSPLGEILYEATRYFAGRNSPTSSYTYSSGADATLGLPNVSWNNPFATYPRCSKANMIVISDLYPSYDSNMIPGGFFGSISSDLPTPPNVSSLSQTIFNGEGLSSVLAFIGQSGNNFDGAPTPKTVTSFGNIRGLAPHEANSEGTYYTAAMAYYAWITDLNAATGVQNVKSFFIGLAPPMPEFKFNVGGNTVTIIPFGKSVGGTGYVINPAQGAYQPTNNIVDIYIDSITPTSAVFRVNFEDVQQGADFDMDAIVEYTITVSGNNITVGLNSNYAAGSIIQHMGYVISGTTQDGVYLEVRDFDTAAASDPDYFLDTPPGKLPGQGWNDNAPLPLVTSRVFTSSGQPAAIFLKSPLWYAAKWSAFNDLNNNNRPDLLDEWDLDRNGDPDNFYLVTNAANLANQLAAAFRQIIDRSGSFSSAALSSGFLNDQTRIYQALFRTKDWTGQLLAFTIDTQTGSILTNGSAANGAQWDTADQLKTQNFNTGRKIITFKPSSQTGIAFRWPGTPASPTGSELDVSQSSFLNINPATGTADGLGSARLEFIRGNTALEARNGGSFRNRSTPLGDIINSAPIAIGAPGLNYPLNWVEGAAENSVSYITFRQTYANRPTVIYVGANDGMLHAIDGSNGNELLAYVPSPVYKNLNQLTYQSYGHKFFVDGSPTVIDALVGGVWRSYLVAGLNAGGQGIYALDVTDPNQFSETNAASIVKWEFTDTDDADLGYTYSQPSIVRLQNGRWAAVFGNGYNNTEADGIASTTGNAVLYVVDLETKAIIRKFDTGVGMSADPLNQGRPNGMSTPAVIDIDGDSIADYVYAGDLFGNVWKIDLTSTTASDWDFAFKSGNNPAPFFVARDSSNNRQPITTRPTVSKVKFSANTLQIYIGTGKYLEATDKTDTTRQTVYALRDNFTSAISGRSVLRQQTIIDESGGTRVVSSNMLANNDRGWYMDLVVSSARGERIISTMTYLGGVLIFSTIIPTSDPCDFGGESWLMELDGMTGARLNYNVFDTNNDGSFNSSDGKTVSDGGNTINAPVSGVQSTVGLISSPAILNAGSIEYKYLPGTSGGIQKITENPGQQAYGRQSWQQLK